MIRVRTVLIIVRLVECKVKCQVVLIGSSRFNRLA